MCATSDLIFDVGMHLGEDTARYLAQGFRVVAFEADPRLVTHCQARFKLEVETGRLEIVAGAVSDSSHDTATLFQFPNETVWSTVDPEWAKRNEVYERARAVEVSTVNFSECLAVYGVPHYLKIDIEGLDQVCLRALKTQSSRPKYVSIESEKRSWFDLTCEFDLLEDLGYSRFSVVQQQGLAGRCVRLSTRDGRMVEYVLEEHSSSDFGAALTYVPRDEALDIYRSAFRRYRLAGDNSLLGRTSLGRWTRRRLRLSPGWFDTHAVLDDLR